MMTMTMNPTAPPEILTLAERLRDVLGPCFDDEGSAKLLAWVREFMRERHEGYVVARLRAGPVFDELSMRAIRATRDPVSRDVAVALGFTDNPFAPQHGTLVWKLCELAGWQDGLDEQGHKP